MLILSAFLLFRPISSLCISYLLSTFLILDSFRFFYNFLLRLSLLCILILRFLLFSFSSFLIIFYCHLVNEFLYFHIVNILFNILKNNKKRASLTLSSSCLYCLIFSKQSRNSLSSTFSNSSRFTALRSFRATRSTSASSRAPSRICEPMLEKSRRIAI